LALAAERAAADAGLMHGALADVDALGVVGFAIDAPGALERLPVPRLKNPPKSLAKRLGAQPRRSLYAHMGGNTPQQLVNDLCERIAAGESDLALAAGAEFLGSLMKRLRAGVGFPADYGDDESEAPERFGDPRPGATKTEAAHGLNFPVNAYPLFENALRARDKRSLEAHQQRLGALFSPFTAVAAQNPYAWFPKQRSAEELITVTDANRMISFPYPKYLNAIMEVDQSAAVIIASVARARALGVPEDRWIHLRGCADAADLWGLLERQNYHSSPAIRLTGRRALDMAGIELDEVDFIDLYSCFPSAVQIAAEELGLALDDPRGLTVTGGLPYAGGPGNNYAMHAIAAMVGKLREKRRAGGAAATGLVTGNGWFLTKQSIGVYATEPSDGPFERESPAVLQAAIDALPHPDIIESPEGRAVIETYTVPHAREGRRLGIVIGRDAAGRRFVANTPPVDAIMADLESRESVGRPGVVSRDAGRGLNIFLPD
jgi:acetyl-CoA C-acetyltransferase